MYENYFNLKSRPFENTPDPSFFFMEGQYRDALAVLKYQVVYQKGITVVVGPSGCGKTTLGNVLLGHLPEGTKIVYIVFLRAAPVELLDYVAQELGVATKGLSTLGLVKSIRATALEIHRNGGQCFLVLDEAQNVGEELLGEIQVLSNLETSQAKLIQILLLGRKELLERLEQPRLDALRQRIAVIKELGPMNESAVSAYIHRRLEVAGGSPDLFAPEALTQVARISGGYPRNINKICDMGLLKSFINGINQVGTDQVFEASAELGFTFSRPQTPRISRSAPPPPKKANLPAESPTKPAVLSKELPDRSLARRAIPSDTPPPGKESMVESKPHEVQPQQRDVIPKKTSDATNLSVNRLPGPASSGSRSRKGLWLALLVVILAALLNWNFTEIARLLPVELTGANRPAAPTITVHGKVELGPSEASAPAPASSNGEPEGAHEFHGHKVSVADVPPPVAQDDQNEEVDEAAPTTQPDEPPVAVPEEKPAPLPPWAVNIPQGSVIITVDDSVQKAVLWRSGLDGTLAATDLEWDGPDFSDLFVMGQSRIKSYPFLFSSSQLTWWPGFMPTQKIRDGVFEKVEDRILPVVILKGADTEFGTQNSLPHEEMSGYLEKWTDAWEKKDLDRLIGFYGDPYTIYFEDGRPWRQWSRQDLYEQKKKLFKDRDPIKMEASSPLCLVNPHDPQTMVMIFNQRYQSGSYTDEGTKILFLRNLGTSESHDWKIVSKLWIGSGMEKSGD